MKRFAALLSGTALAAALSFGAQANTPPANTADKPAATDTTKKHVKKHRKAKKGAAAATSTDSTKK